MTRNANHPSIQLIYFPDVLFRATAIAKDLDYFFDGKWRQKLTTDTLPTTLRYAERLRLIGLQEPELLIAHAYARNLGDLANGSALKALLRVHCGLKDEQGLNFFSFSCDSQFRTAYTHRLNATAETEHEIEQQIDEGNSAFQFIADICQEIKLFSSCDTNFSKKCLAMMNNTESHKIIFNIWKTYVKVENWIKFIVKFIWLHIHV